MISLIVGGTGDGEYANIDTVEVMDRALLVAVSVWDGRQLWRHILLVFSFFPSMWSEIDPRSSLDMCDWSVIFHSMDYPLTLFFSLSVRVSLSIKSGVFSSLVFPRPFVHCRLFHSVLPVNSCLFWSFIVFVYTINDWSRSHSLSIELVHPYTWVILRSSQTRRFTQVPFLPTVSFLFFGRRS